jgi:hypothetical protein
MATRGKKTKEEKTQSKAVEASRDAELEELIEDVTARLSVSSDAADIMANLCGERAHALMHDRPLVDAARGLWAKGNAAHALTGLLTQLATELERHDEVMRQVGTALEQLVEQEGAEVEPDEEDLAAIAQVIEDDQAHDHGGDEDGEDHQH